MRNPYVMCAFLTLFIAFANAQTNPETPTVYDSGWQFSLRGCYDFPTYNNDTPYIDYKGGIMAGASIDYYWRWFGFGADFDYIKNSPDDVYPKRNLVYQGNNISNFNGHSDRITRTFYGVGPNFKYQKNNRFSAELKLRAGLASLTGGKTSLQGNWPDPNAIDFNTVDLNFHAGYSRKQFFSVKGALQFNYYFSDRWGAHVGAYYLEHFKVKEDSIDGRSSGYRDYQTTTADGVTIHTVDNAQNLRAEPCDCEIHSIGVFAGVTYRIPKKRVEKKAEPKKPLYALEVTSRDKFSQELLPGTEVRIVNTKGFVVKMGKTDERAKVVFDSIAPDNYSIEGMFYGQPMEKTTALKNEFKPNIILQKTILYGDLNVILKAAVVDAQTQQPIGNVLITSNGKTIPQDELSNFMSAINPDQGASFYMKKEGYFSKTHTLEPESLNRKKSLFVTIEIPMEKFDCGKAIALENIHYDLDKSFVRDDAKPELDKLVLFLKDNPSISVELGSHTDCRASAKYNQKLSQQRADAAVAYIVSQGIAKNRITGKGYGERRLLNRCADKVPCTEEEHQANRRTEMKVICP